MPSRIMICEGSFTSTRDDKPLVVENENGRYVAFSPPSKGINASLRSLFQSIHKRHLSSIEYVSHALSGIFVLKKASHWMTVAPIDVANSDASTDLPAPLPPSHDTFNGLEGSLRRWLMSFSMLCIDPSKVCTR